MNPQNEPVFTVNMILSVVRSGLLMLLALDIFDLTNQQLEAVMGFAAAISLAVDAAANAWVRGQVTPVRKFRPRVQKAIQAGKQDEVRAPIAPRPPERETVLP